MKETKEKISSPNWGITTKAIVSLIILAAVVALIFKFSSLMSTVVTAIVFAILFNPLVKLIHTKLRISWGWSVMIVYLVTLVMFFGLLTLGGIAILDQVQGFIKFLQDSLGAIATFFEQLPTTVVKIGPFILNFSYFNWTDIGKQLLSTLEPILSNLGNFFGGIASGTAGFIGSMFLALVISFLILNESGGSKRPKGFALEMPAYQKDFSLLGKKINTIWDAFIRGQSIVYLIRFIMYLIILSIFRVRFLFGLALVATLGNFIPYIGVAISWITIFVVALLQGSTAYGLAPFPYALITMAVGWISDNAYDTFFSPRFLAHTLDVHPAAILVGVFVGLNLFGFWGMVLAAPIIATLKIVLTYIGKKLTDQDPWTDTDLVTGVERLPPLGKILKSISDQVGSEIGKNKKISKRIEDKKEK
jgi:predicted PurR-regulated permease PerM